MRKTSFDFFAKTQKWPESETRQCNPASNPGHLANKKTAPEAVGSSFAIFDGAIVTQN
jgi:hypothetical protein